MQLVFVSVGLFSICVVWKDLGRLYGRIFFSFQWGFQCRLHSCTLLFALLLQMLPFYKPNLINEINGFINWLIGIHLVNFFFHSLLWVDIFIRGRTESRCIHMALMMNLLRLFLTYRITTHWYKVPKVFKGLRQCYRCCSRVINAVQTWCTENTVGAWPVKTRCLFYIIILAL